MISHHVNAPQKKTLNRGKEETGKKDKRTEEKNDTKI